MADRGGCGGWHWGSGRGGRDGHCRGVVVRGIQGSGAIEGWGTVNRSGLRY